MRPKFQYMKRLLYLVGILLLNVLGCLAESEARIVRAYDVYENNTGDSIIGRVMCEAEELIYFGGDTASVYVPTPEEIALVEKILLKNEEYIRSKNPYLKEPYKIERKGEWYLGRYFRQYVFRKSEKGRRIVDIQIIRTDPDDEDDFGRRNLSKREWMLIYDGGDFVGDIRIDLKRKKILYVYFHGLA